jgi:dynein heavy chain 1
MLVGNSGSGKSSAWRVLLKALERLEGIEGVCHVINPKALSKEALYGFMDPNTRGRHVCPLLSTLNLI